MVRADRDPPGIGAEIVDAIRIALPIASEGKSCTLTRSGWPFGRHSAPPLANSPTFSFFLASTETTGWPASRCSRAVRAM